MQFIEQKAEDILASLKPLEVEWKDDTANRVIGRIEQVPVRSTYSAEDIKGLFAPDFNDGLLICRLFLGLSKDSFEGMLLNALGKGGCGATRYKGNPDEYVDALVRMGLLEAMTEAANRPARWSDVLVERLRSGRGRAISGQRRGRELEDFAEQIIDRVFPNRYCPRCQFTGIQGRTAKCDFAIPNREQPRILVEAKAYGATGSKMSDVIGDIDAIIDAKRPDTSFLLFTDGITWRQRQSDFRKLVQRQNNGQISRIYTTSMALQFEQDLRTLKHEHNI